MTDVKYNPDVIMTPDMYQVHAARTLVAQWPDLSEADAMLVWVALGLVGEVNELLSEVYKIGVGLTMPSHVILRNELGDCFWYAAGICSNRGWEFVDVVSARVSSSKAAIDLAIEAAIAAGEVAEIVKKGVLHGHGMTFEIHENLLGALTVCVDRLINLCTHYRATLPDVLSGNIAKLLKRYPKRFNASDSVARVDKGADNE